MIYLVQLDNAYKIGYAKNVEKRIKNLSATHVVVNLIDSKEGEISDEKALHKLCGNFKIKNELFEINDSVINTFKEYTASIKEPKQKYKHTIQHKFEFYDERLDDHERRISALEEQMAIFKEQLNEY